MTKTFYEDYNEKAEDARELIVDLKKIHLLPEKLRERMDERIQGIIEGVLLATEAGKTVNDPDERKAG